MCYVCCAALLGVTITPCFAAPEVLAGFIGIAYENLSPAADVWSAACLVFELLTGRPLFTRAPKHQSAAGSDQVSPDSPAALHPSSSAGFPDSMTWDQNEVQRMRPEPSRPISPEQQHILQQHEQWVSPLVTASCLAQTVMSLSVAVHFHCLVLRC